MLRESDVPVLVDFYASWCGPCVMMNPELHKVSTTFKDEIKVVKVDTDKYPAIATKVCGRSSQTYTRSREEAETERERVCVSEKIFVCFDLDASTHNYLSCTYVLALLLAW